MKDTVTYNGAILRRLGCCIFFMILFFPSLSNAQTRGKLEEIKDPLIDTLIARRPNLNRGSATQQGGEETAYGYRVQIFFGSNRQSAYNTQAKFTEDYPEYHTYIFYTEPNFKVQVGDFRSRLEAQKLENELRQQYTSLFIISGKINPPKTEASND